VELRRLSVVAAVCLALVSLGGCGSDVSSSSGGDTGSGSAGSCAFSLEFQGRTYIAAGNSGGQAEPGKALGEAALTPCADGDGVGQGTVTVYSVVGRSLGEALYLKDPQVGLLIPDPQSAAE
jgi:hypothetical protein